jgi:hypothetical protein
MELKDSAVCTGVLILRRLDINNCQQGLESWCNMIEQKESEKIPPDRLETASVSMMRAPLGSSTAAAHLTVHLIPLPDCMVGKGQ